MKVCYRDLFECGSHSRDWQIIQNSIPDFEPVEIMQDADVAIIYLCGLAEQCITAAQEEVEKVGLISSRNPKLKVFIGGCAAELKSVKDVLAKYNLTNVFAKDNMAKVVLDRLGLKPSEEPAPCLKYHTANISISRGCRRRCGFCKTWYLNMEYHSVPKDVILREVGYALDRGFLHVCITAENSTEYGVDIYNDGKGHLEELLREIFQTHPGIKVMDVMGVCLDEVDDSLVDYFLEEKRINEIQMEVQSFIPEVRENMLLKRSAEEAKALYTKLRSCKAVKSNIIVGYPGENLTNFGSQLEYFLANKETCWSFDVMPLDNTPGTRSYTMEPVDDEVADLNVANLIEAIEKMRGDWVTRVQNSKEPLRTYAAAHRRGKTLCIVWGQSAIVEVNEKLPLYEDYQILPGGCLDIFRTGDNYIVMSGTVVH